MVEELLPRAVACLAQMGVKERAVPRLDGLLDERHVDLLWRATPFLGVARRTGADDVVPGRGASHAPGDHVIERQLADGKSLATILAAVAIAGEDIAPVELQTPGRNAVVSQRRS